MTAVIVFDPHRQAPLRFWHPAAVIGGCRRAGRRSARSSMHCVSSRTTSSTSISKAGRCTRPTRLPVLAIPSAPVATALVAANWAAPGGISGGGGTSILLFGGVPDFQHVGQVNRFDGLRTVP